MQAFELVMSMTAPDVFAGPPDPEAEGFEDFMKAVDAMKNANHEQLMAMGRGSLHHLKTGGVLENNPNPPKTN
jgi:hypothetical protein